MLARTQRWDKNLIKIYQKYCSVTVSLKNKWRKKLFFIDGPNDTNSLSAMP
jgi:hypothetical protein